MALINSPLKRAGLALLLLVIAFSLNVQTAYSEARPGVRVGGQRFTTEVKSLSELRWQNLTRQGWDISCGAAALSTLLIYHHGRQFSELAVTLTILKNTDPEVVRSRGGFSLYDLKRFVRAIGLDGVGYGEMTLDDLGQFDVPAILPVRIGELDHFVIFRKRIGGHVMLGDPAFGNISMSADRFERMWKSRIAFYVVTPEEKELMARLESAKIRSPLSPDVMELAIPDLYYGTRILSRIPTLPLTRRMTTVTP